jgi:hypothetical protein
LSDKDRVWEGEVAEKQIWPKFQWVFDGEVGKNYFTYTSEFRGISEPVRI